MSNRNITIFLRRATLVCALTTPALLAQQTASQLNTRVQSLSSAQADLTPPTGPQLLAALDADMRNVVLIYDSIKGSHLEALTPQDARQQISIQDAAKILARGVDGAASATPVGKVVDGMTITSDSGVQVPIRLYYPMGNGPFPVVLYFHGGGFVVSTMDTYDESARALCNGANALVVSVEYRKAPEAPFPAAYKDAIHAYNWVLGNITAYNGISTKVAVAGESAGGNLATEVALYAKSQKMQMPTHELLIYPETSANFNQLSDQLFTDSVLPLYTAELPYFGAQYLQASADTSDPRAVPMLNDLHGMPATTIIAAEEDPLLSDGQAYYAALAKANVIAKYVLYTGTTHEFFGMGSVVAKAKTAEQVATQRLVDSFK